MNPDDAIDTSGITFAAQEAPYLEEVTVASPVVDIVAAIRKMWEEPTPVSRVWEYHTLEEMQQNARKAEQQDRLNELFAQRNNHTPMNRAARRSAAKRSNHGRD